MKQKISVRNGRATGEWYRLKEKKELENPKVTSDFKKRLESLWSDDRSYRKQLVLALTVLFSLCFTFLFFGPMEITAYAQASLVFNMKMALPVMAVFTVAVCAAVALVLSLLHGKIFNYILTALFSLLVCGYLQGNFLNGKQLGALTGDAIKWESRKGLMVRDLLVWLLVFLVPFVILYFSKKVWKKTLIYVSAALVVMQSVAFVTLFTSGTVNTAANKNNYLIQKKKGNILPNTTPLFFCWIGWIMTILKRFRQKTPASLTSWMALQATTMPCQSIPVQSPPSTIFSPTAT